MNTLKHYLHGEWDFSFTHPVTKKFYSDKATVPGNVEPELLRMGLVDDYFPSDRRDATLDFEIVDDWTYQTVFDAPELKFGYERNLVFDGIDTVAEIYLNGEKLRDCCNMHRQWKFPVGDKLRAKGNELKVIIHSPELWARDHTADMFPLSRNASTQFSSNVYLRKARHCWGWDNAPRLMTSGIYRPVYLEDVPVERFENLYFYTERIDETAGTANVAVHWTYQMPRDISCRGHVCRITLSFEGKVLFTGEEEIFTCRGVRRFALPLDQVKLWWPYGMGDPNLCDLKLEMIHNGIVKTVYEAKWGIRTVKLIQSKFLDSKGNGEFVFVVNNYKTMIRGTNWKNTDPLHSKADAKVLDYLQYVKELNCNMVRIWGGGIYEDHPFFDFCDQNGILVWHDFMFACELTPKDEWYCEEVRAEATEIIRKLRNHASIANWCGDNEGDMFFRAYQRGSNALPSDQVISREILKECVLRNDPYRDYVASSPMIPDECVFEDRVEFFQKPAELHDGNAFLEPEVTHAPLEWHLYPNKEDYATALRERSARFLGETGAITFNQMTDDEEIWEREKARAVRLWDVDINKTTLPFCDQHQSDYYFIRWISCGREQVRKLFNRDFTVEEWKPYCMALNTVCARLFKDAIEYTRANRWTKTGILWWSLADMWPMLFNYSMVDSKGNRKLPYYWIRQSQRDFILMAVRQELNEPAVLYASNDTLEEKIGTYRITAYDENGNASLFATGGFQAPANKTTKVAQIVEDGKQQLLLIEWMQDGKPTHCNHFVTGQAPYSFETWKIWHEILKQHFSADAN